MPVAAEELAQRAQVFRGRERGLFGVGPLVDVPVAPQPVFRLTALG
jgi:hypothetical protein